MTALLSVQGIECQYDDQPVFQNLSLHINKGDFTCLLGKSGCGKTTALRAIAGFEPVTAGEIALGNTIASKPGYLLAPEKRNMGMVFQDYALFPHMDVMNNICFGLRQMSAMAKRKTAARLLKVVGLESFEARYPHELSGGQQQRVALARALAARPNLILMDEPFSNLDVDLRERIGIEVRDILKNEGIASILVTHDQQEAFVLADLIGVMDQGQIIQWDTPFNLYHKPINHFIADFIGQGAFLKGTLLNPETVETGVGLIKGNNAYTLPIGCKVDVLLRPDDIIPAPDSPLRSKVIQRAFKGASILYTLQLTSGDRILALFPSHYNYNIGEQIGFQLNAQHLILFPTT